MSNKSNAVARTTSLENENPEANLRLAAESLASFGFVATRGELSVDACYEDCVPPDPDRKPGKHKTHHSMRRVLDLRNIDPQLLSRGIKAMQRVHDAIVASRMVVIQQESA